MDTDVIAIDGHAGAGKGEAAKSVAKHLGMRMLDTGSFYRSIAYVYNDKQTDFSRITVQDGQILIDGKPATADMIRTKEIGAIVSGISQKPEIRTRVSDLIRASITEEGLVADGRDMGSVVFPNAKLKIFLTASAEIRARRIMNDENRHKSDANFFEVLGDILLRDHEDETREHAPLIKTKDAILIDTSHMTKSEVSDTIKYLWKRKAS